MRIQQSRSDAEAALEAERALHAEEERRLRADAAQRIADAQAEIAGFARMPSS